MVGRSSLTVGTWCEGHWAQWTHGVGHFGHWSHGVHVILDYCVHEL